MIHTDNSLIKLFLPILTAGLIADGFLNVAVKQSNQPTMQGINTGGTLYFFKVSNKRYGYLGRFDKWNSDLNAMQHFENQHMEITFQIAALVLQYPITPNQFTASDLVNEAASIMQSDNTRQILNNSKVGILRVQEISNPYFFDDRDNFEASPSFDFVLTYEDQRVTTDPIISRYNYNIIGV